MHHTKLYRVYKQKCILGKSWWPVKLNCISVAYFCAQAIFKLIFKTRFFTRRNTILYRCPKISNDIHIPKFSLMMRARTPRRYLPSVNFFYTPCIICSILLRLNVKCFSALLMWRLQRLQGSFNPIKFAHRAAQRHPIFIFITVTP